MFCEVVVGCGWWGGGVGVRGWVEGRGLANALGKMRGVTGIERKTKTYTDSSGILSVALVSC